MKKFRVTASAVKRVRVRGFLIAINLEYGTRFLTAEAVTLNFRKFCLTNILIVTKLITVMAANSQFAVAIHVLTILAKGGDERVKSDYIAGSVNTNPVVIRRLLSNLQEANLVVSHVGAAGGTTLTKQPKDIRLSEVYKALPCGEVFALHPKEPNQDCPIGKNMAAFLCGLQKEIDKSIEEKLRQYTLRDVIEHIEEA